MQYFVSQERVPKIYRFKNIKIKHYFNQTPPSPSAGILIVWIGDAKSTCNKYLEHSILVTSDNGNPHCFYRTSVFTILTGHDSSSLYERVGTLHSLLHALPSHKWVTYGARCTMLRRQFPVRYSHDQYNTISCCFLTTPNFCRIISAW